MSNGSRFVLPYQTVIDATGVPLPGALLFFYASGTSSPLNTYSDEGLTTPNSNPVVANPAGEFPNIFLSGAGYKVILTDYLDNQIWTADPVFGIGVESLSSYYSFDTTADLLTAFGSGVILANATQASTSGRDVANGPGGNEFSYNALDTTTPDNGGTIRVDAQGRRWYALDAGFDVLLFGAKGDGSTNDYTAIEATITAAAVRGGTVIFSDTGHAYITHGGLTIPYGVSVVGETRNVIIEPGASMTDLIVVTSSIGTSISNITLANASSYATNGLTLNPASPGDNYNYFDYISIVGFTNNVRNVNSTAHSFSNIFSQNASGWSYLSEDDSRNCCFDKFNVLGGGGMKFTQSSIQPEGIEIVNSIILPTGGTALYFDGGFTVSISNCIFDQCDTAAIVLDGSTHAIANMQLTNLWCGPRSGASDRTIGIDIKGNVNDILLSGVASNGWSLAGARLQSSASEVHKVTLLGCRFDGNGTGAGSADLLVDTSVNAVTNIVAVGCFFNSTGGSVQSILEGSTSVGNYSLNTFAAGTTQSPLSAYNQNFGSGGTPWASYTPTCTPGAGAFTTVSTAGKFYQIDKQVWFSMRLDIVNHGTGSGAVVTTLPTVGADPVCFAGREDGVTGHMVQAFNTTGGNNGLSVLFYDNSSPIADGAIFVINGTYEAG